jgi:2-dehydropantoate 2-reductase
MRFIVLGAGAIGGVIGGRLFEHGHDVVLVARGAHREAIARSGLRLESPDSTVTLHIPVVGDPGEVTFGAEDVVLLAVKSQDTSAVIDALSSVARPSLPVVCIQNGVENERVALRRFANVYGVCVMCPATHLLPGVVQAHSTPVSGILDLGCWPSGVDETAETIAAALRSATFSSVARFDIARWKYAKLLTNLANAVEAVCGTPARQGPIGRLARKEGIAVLQAGGVDFASAEEDAARRGDLLAQRPIGSQTRGRNSTWQSLSRSTGSVETAYLNGEIVLMGRLLGLSTPVNDTLLHHVARMARTRMPPGSVPEDELLRSIESAI